MPKRSSEAAGLSATEAKQPRQSENGKPIAIPEGEDEGMGEFEDQWEDDAESEEEYVMNGEDGEGEGEGDDEDIEMTGAPEDDDEEEKPDELETYLPGISRPLEADEVLEPDYSVYQALHQLSYNWPCLSFDILRDNLGWERNKFPHTAWVVIGTQAGEEGSSSGGASNGVGNGLGKNKDEVVVMRWGGLSRTKGDDSDSEDEDEEDPDEVDEDAHLEYLSIPHSGSVNRIRARPQPANMGLPPAGTPYHVATMAETGKVHIFDVRPLMDQLESPSAALPRSEKSKRPVHTIHDHGRHEGFALDWAASPSTDSNPANTTDLRLLTGDIASHIFLTQFTPNGITTQPKPFLSHTSSIEDLQWSPSEPTVFVSCSADRSIRVWDVRVKNRKSVTGIVGAHEEDVNVISWNRGVEYLMCSGGDEGGIKVWDLRNLKGGATPSPVAHFNWHKKPITSIEWHPTDTSLLVAGSSDDSVTLWDLSVEADQEEAATKKITEMNGGVVVPPQLLFVHQGQKDVKEVHWHPQIPGMIVSTAGDGFNAFKTISA